MTYCIPSPPEQVFWITQRDKLKAALLRPAIVDLHGAWISGRKEKIVGAEDIIKQLNEGTYPALCEPEHDSEESLLSMLPAVESFFTPSAQG